MNRPRASAWSSLQVVALVAGMSVVPAAGCGSDEAIVGGTCAAGYTDCANQCVLLASDPSNCGACGRVCPGGMCGGGSCGGLRDGATDGRAPHDSGLRDGTLADARPDARDAGHVDGSRRDGPSSDATDATDAPTDTRATDAPATDHTSPDAPVDGSHDTGIDQCAPPYTTPAQCGGCGMSCPAGDVCSPAVDAGLDAGLYQCLPMCPAPYEDCLGTCIDERADPGNCGACGRTCPSGICVNNKCEGATAGNMVVIGHDYAAAGVLAGEARVLANAVFLPPTNPLRVLSFEQYADARQVANVKTTLTANAPLGRTANYTVFTDYTAVASGLSLQTFDVLLVYDQATAPMNVLATIGGALATPISNFVAVGGDVVVLDGASGPTKQMTQFLSASMVLQASAENPVPATDHLIVVAPGDAVGNFVLSPYAPIADTVSFTTSEANGGSVTYIVDDIADASILPVVIHKTPPAGP